MQLSEENRHALLIALHQVIEEQAAGYASDVFQGQEVRVDYPPNGGLSAAEVAALRVLQGNALAQAALRKVLAGCAAGTIFSLLSLLDGASDPEQGNWTGVTLVDSPKESETHGQFLHEAFFETYWDWRARRPTKGWCLDNLPD